VATGANAPRAIESSERHRAMAVAAADVVLGLRQRVEADEPLTPEFVALLCEWPWRVYAHDLAAARSDAERRAAADVYWRSLVEIDEMSHVTGCFSDLPPSPRMPIAEYALRGAELRLAKAHLPPAPSRLEWAGGRATAAGAPPTLAELARDVIQFSDRWLEQAEVSPELLGVACEWSRRLCAAESESADGPAGRLRAATAHSTRLTKLRALARARPADDLAFPRDEIDYSIAEARLLAAEASPHTPQQLAALRREMADAARRHVDGLRKRKKAGEPLTPEFVEALCVASRRLAAATGDPRGHLARMRDLHADLKRHFDQDQDVTRIQVSQSAYFLREAEAPSE
jgi:hypothetical protein